MPAARIHSATIPEIVSATSPIVGRLYDRTSGPEHAGYSAR